MGEIAYDAEGPDDEEAVGGARAAGPGIGTALVRYALVRLRTRPEPLVFLEGSPATTRGSASWPGTLGYHRASSDHDAVGLRSG